MIDVKYYNKKHIKHMGLDEFKRYTTTFETLGLNEEQIKKISDYPDGFFALASTVLLTGNSNYSSMIEIFDKYKDESYALRKVKFILLYL